MKIDEVIIEGKISKGAKSSTPDMQTYPALNNNNSPYAAYRFGVALAGAPDFPMDRDGPIGGDFTTIGYSDADREILDAAAKLMGVSPSAQTPKGSTELKGTNTKSVIRTRKLK